MFLLSFTIHGFSPSPCLVEWDRPLQAMSHRKLGVLMSGVDKNGEEEPGPVGKAGNTRLARLVGGATVTRSVDGACGPRGLAEFLLSAESDASLLNTGTYRRLGDGRYECDLASIRMFDFGVVPMLTVRLERSPPDQLRIRVLGVRISLQTPSSEPRLLEGVVIDSSNVLYWQQGQGQERRGQERRGQEAQGQERQAQAHEGQGKEGQGQEGQGQEGQVATQLRTELSLGVTVQLPRGFPLPRSAIERPGSAILLRVSKAQCHQFLREVEEGWRAWRTLSDDLPEQRPEVRQD